MIVLTTPTGLIGHQVLKNVLDKGEPVRVIARDPSKLPAEVLKRVDVVQGSHADPAVVNKAFRDADAVFWLVPPDPQATSVEAAYVDFSGRLATPFAAKESSMWSLFRVLVEVSLRRSERGTSRLLWQWTISLPVRVLTTVR